MRTVSTTEFALSFGRTFDIIRFYNRNIKALVLLIVVNISLAEARRELIVLIQSAQYQENGRNGYPYRSGRRAGPVRQMNLPGFSSGSLM